MGKRHKRRRMVNKIAPHKGPVFLAKPVALAQAPSLQVLMRNQQAQQMPDWAMALSSLASAMGRLPF
jgi:hypothetical protein